jgi:hypothetical protein
VDSFEQGFLVGILVGEGHFGGDGRKAQVTLRMHTRHQRMFEWLLTSVPGSRLYGPYHHGGRSYFQWMARGKCLEEQLLPLLGRHLAFLDDHARSRIELMCSQYGLVLPDAAKLPGP